MKDKMKHFSTFPRIRGGDPNAEIVRVVRVPFSPHTRG